MKIIDAHLHFFPEAERFTEIARRAGHEATLAHVTRAMRENGVVKGIGMGTTPRQEGNADAGPLTLPFDDSEWPACFAQCLGVDTAAITPQNCKASVDAFHEKLQSPQTVGMKIYAGYQHFYVYDPIYDPYYELAEAADVPVVIHTGDTANAAGRLKYSHPLTVDEVAVRFPRVNFVIAHYGNPWLVDATEVVKKNPNVYADLSGLAEGAFEAGEFNATYRGYIETMQTWLTYLSRYDKLLYGSDWPLVNMKSYIEWIASILPEAQHEAVFYENAKRLFRRLRIEEE